MYVSSGAPALTYVTFSENHAGFNGGGLYVYAHSSSPHLTAVTFSGNTADFDGGGMYNGGSPTFSSVVFFNNSARYGGGIYNTSSLTFTSLTFYGNSATQSGGGIYNAVSLYLSLKNTIVRGNTATTGPEIYTIFPPVISYSNIEGCGGSGSGWNTACGTDDGGNIDADPLFVDAPNGDLHILPSSPCVDTGDNAAVPAGVNTDIDGSIRIFDGDGTGSSVVDMVADEYNAVTLTSPNGGETLPSGGQHTITWTALPEAVSFDLEYSINDGGTWKPVATGVTGTSYAWNLPAVAGNKRKCRVRITGYDSGSSMVGQDISDDRFLTEVIKVTSPNGGEVLKFGTTHTITWETNATKTPITKVVIKYHKVGVPGWILIKVIKGGNPGSYDWPVPPLIGDHRIKVNLWDANKNRRGADKSDSAFAIIIH